MSGLRDSHSWPACRGGIGGFWDANPSSMRGSAIELASALLQFFLLEDAFGFREQGVVPFLDVILERLGQHLQLSRSTARLSAVSPRPLTSRTGTSFRAFEPSAHIKHEPCLSEYGPMVDFLSTMTVDVRILCGLPSTELHHDPSEFRGASRGRFMRIGLTRVTRFAMRGGCHAVRMITRSAVPLHASFCRAERRQTYAAHLEPGE